LPPLALPQPSLAQQAAFGAGFSADFALRAFALAAGAAVSDAGAAQASPFFALHPHFPPATVPQDAPWQQAAFGAALALLLSLSFAAGASAAMARPALNVSAAIMVSIFVFMW